ncbi:hypothetical protein J6I90_00930 [Pseudidiomarina sp. 1APP75-32.1]|uniref:Uncharacterized protein n=1 Tax=Pseudidiomarina terrestris TaxID=2820060 RepID=A0AAW7QVK7_9GAMM|nr:MULTISPECIES: hypothetical protein [unclassified Pseudidiomarina]MDN7123441.1 hypothetical protein [Pseudidiomarina sp. 1APP75-32.1]MDN7128833.1 hypothetical protein [Pseudidiomarina sp. 1APR75-15]
MSMRIALKVLMVWAGILVLAIANGLLRESVLLPTFGTPAALVLSGLILSALILMVAYLSLPWLQVNSNAQLFLVGISWLALTLVFEFSFGLWQGKSWPELLEAYSFKDGNIWLVVLLVTTLSPYIAGKLRVWWK